jgi:hypothetical protein
MESMGLLDSLFGKKCPLCGTKGARTSDGSVRCPNPSCQYFDVGLAHPHWKQFDYSPARPLTIHYRNFQGLDRTFTVDADSLQRKHNHIVARVAPTGRHISLSRDRIQNLSEVDEAAGGQAGPGKAGPTARERQVLGYHKKHHSTSPLYEKIRAKYPDG